MNAQPQNPLPSPINPQGIPPVADAEALGKARLQIIDLIAWLERLKENPDFQRFRAFVLEGAEETRREAENITIHSTEKLVAFAQKHFAYAAIYDYPEKALLSLRLQLKAMDERKA